VLAANISGLRSGLVLPQDRNDPLFRDPKTRYESAGIVCSFPLAVSVEKFAENKKIENVPQDNVRVCPECGQEVLDEE